MPLDVGDGPRPQTGSHSRDQRRHVGRELFERLEDLGGERVEQMRVARAFVEDDELVVPGLPVEAGAFRELPANFSGGRVGDGR